MKNNNAQLTNEIIATIRVSLRLQIVNAWKNRDDSFYRQQVKENVQALRVMREITRRG